MRKISNIIEKLEKAKYTRREGTPGNYKYFYDTPASGSAPSPKKEMTPAEKRERLSDLRDIRADKGLTLDEEKELKTLIKETSVDLDSIYGDTKPERGTPKNYPLNMKQMREGAEPPGSNKKTKTTQIKDFKAGDKKSESKSKMPATHEEAKKLMKEMGISNVGWWGKDGINGTEPDGEWTPEASITERMFGKERPSEADEEGRYVQAKKKMQPKVDEINKKLKEKGFKPNASMNMQEKGYVTIDFRLEPDVEKVKKSLDDMMVGYLTKGKK